MKNTARFGVFLGLAAVFCLHMQAGHAQDLRGRWRVKSFTTTTLSLDGQRKIKGPFPFQPKAMWISVDKQKLIEDMNGKRFEYQIKKDGKEYTLTRKDQDPNVTSHLSDIQKTKTGATFTTTRLNPESQERTVVNWVCVPAKPDRR